MKTIKRILYSLLVLIVLAVIIGFVLLHNLKTAAITDYYKNVELSTSEKKIRIDPGNQDEFINEKGCRIMDFTKHPMKGYLYICQVGVDMDNDPNKWIKVV